MEEIRIQEKPDWVEWNDIHDILFNAHKANRDRGIFMRTSVLTGEELKKRLGDGICLVAFVGGKLAGTASIKFIQRNRWYAHEVIGDLMLIGILPEYKGLGIYKRLYTSLEDIAKQNKLNILELDTNENNITMQKISLGWGFKYVSMFASPYVKHYSVVMAKWLNGCPYSDLYLKIRYAVFCMKFKLRIRPGNIRRFDF